MRKAIIIRRVDELGRIVLPKEIRRNLSIGSNDLLEIFVEKERILLKKYEPACSLCGNDKDLIEFKGKSVCSCCKSEFADELSLCL